MSPYARTPAVSGTGRYKCGVDVSDDEINRIIVRVGAGHPELRDDLKALPPQARAERLRSLASAALLMRGSGSSNGAGTSQPAAPAAAASDNDPDAERRRRFARLKGKLGDAE